MHIYIYPFIFIFIFILYIVCKYGGCLCGMTYRNKSVPRGDVKPCNGRASKSAIATKPQSHFVGNPFE